MGAVRLAQGELCDAGAFSQALGAGTSLTALRREGGCRGASLQVMGALAGGRRRVMGHHSGRKVKSFSIRGGEKTLGLFSKAGKNT